MVLKSIFQLLSGYSNVYCHHTCVLDVWHISYEGTGYKQHTSSMLRSSQVLSLPYVAMLFVKQKIFTMSSFSHLKDSGRTPRTPGPSGRRWAPSCRQFPILCTYIIVISVSSSYSWKIGSKPPTAWYIGKYRKITFLVRIQAA